MPCWAVVAAVRGAEPSAERISGPPCCGVGGRAHPAEPRVWALVVIIGAPSLENRARMRERTEQGLSINEDVIPDLRKPEVESDFYFVEAEDPETAVPLIVELVKTRIPRRFGLDPIGDVQVLCPMNRGGVGARSLSTSSFRPR
jgi:hypothetical protein